MVKRRRPISSLLTNNQRPIDIMGLSADVLRNAPNLTRFGGPEVPMVPPAGGRPMEAATMEFIGFLSSHYLSTREEREKSKAGKPPPRNPGQRFDFDAWLRQSAIHLKYFQAGLSCQGKDRVHLVNRYLTHPDAGVWRHDEQGINVEAMKKWRKTGPASRGKVWSKESAALLTSLWIPPGLDALDVELQRAHLLGLASWADEFFRPYLEDQFPITFFTLFLDFSKHTESEISRLTISLRNLTSLTPSERLERLAVILTPAIESLADLIDDGVTEFSVIDPRP